VRDCVVVARETEPGERRLVGYVVGEVEEGALRTHLRGRLPEYMVPGAFVVLERLPLTPNGKLDRGALPAPGHAPAEGCYVAPRTPVEEVLAGIWAEVLRRDRVGATDDFFKLGGDSLLATRVAVRARELLGRDVSLVSLFSHRILADFAEAASAALPIDPDDDMLAGFDEPADIGTGSAEFPLTHA
jgi:hypothetical protein